MKLKNRGTTSSEKSQKILVDNKLVAMQTKNLPASMGLSTHSMHLRKPDGNLKVLMTFSMEALRAETTFISTTLGKGKMSNSRTGMSSIRRVRRIRTRIEQDQRIGDRVSNNKEENRMDHSMTTSTLIVASNSKTLEVSANLSTTRSGRTMEATSTLRTTRLANNSGKRR